MGAFGCAGSLACVLLVTLQLCGAAPNKSQAQMDPNLGISQSKPPFMAKLPGCPMYQVGQGKTTKQVTLEDTLTFLVNPSHPILIMDIVISEEQVYQATVDSSRIELYDCNANRTHCEEVKSEATKSSSLLNPRKDNNVTVSLANNQITVSVNMEENVMGDVMPVKGDQRDQSSSIKVSIRNSKGYGSTVLPSGYSVNVNVACNETYTPVVEDGPKNPDTTTESTVIYPAPFENCSLYQVGQNYPVQSVKMMNNLTLALFPSHPLMCIHVIVQEDLFKVTFDGTMTEIQKCLKDGQNCTMSSEGGAKTSDHFDANEWNEVTISLSKSKLEVSVNDQTTAYMGINLDEEEKYAEVRVVSTDDRNSQSVYANYTASVNIDCTEEEPEIKILTTPATNYTPDAVVDTTTPAPDEGSNTTLIVVLVVLAIVLCIIVGALVASTIKKRRKAVINQHTPLNVQQQQ